MVSSIQCATGTFDTIRNFSLWSLVLSPSPHLSPSIMAKTRRGGKPSKSDDTITKKKAKGEFKKLSQYGLLLMGFIYKVEPVQHADAAK